MGTVEPCAVRDPLAERLAAVIGENITGCELISWFDSEFQTYRSYIVGGPPGFDFPITTGMGIFLVVNEESIWYGEG